MIRLGSAFVLVLFLCACSVLPGSSSEEASESHESQTPNSEDEANYVSIEREIRIPTIGSALNPSGPFSKLWGEAEFPKEIGEETYKKLVVGDSLTVVTEQGIYEMDRYPTVVSFVNDGYVRHFSRMCEIVEVTIEGSAIVSQDSSIDYSRLYTQDSIIIEGDRLALLEGYSSAYATLSLFEENVAVALYSYNPRG